MADQSPTSAQTIDVYVCGVIGREGEVLLARRRAGGWELPGTRVAGGEWAVDGVARGVREVVGVGIDAAEFLCIIEDRDGLVLIFDVIPEEETTLPDRTTEDSEGNLVWTPLDQLDSVELWPGRLQHALTNDSPPWLGHDWPKY